MADGAGLCPQLCQRRLCLPIASKAHHPTIPPLTAPTSARSRSLCSWSPIAAFMYRRSSITPPKRDPTSGIAAFNAWKGLSADVSNHNHLHAAHFSFCRRRRPPDPHIPSLCFLFSVLRPLTTTHHHITTMSAGGLPRLPALAPPLPSDTNKTLRAGANYCAAGTILAHLIHLMRRDPPG